MSWRQTLLSIFIAFVCLAKIAEAVLQIENFPLSRMGMFARYRGANEIPWTVTLEVWRRDQWAPVPPFLLGMSPDTLRARLGTRLYGLGARCGALREMHNRAAAPAGRWEHLRARALGRARPGSGRTDRVILVPCRTGRRVRTGRRSTP